MQVFIGPFPEGDEPRQESIEIHKYDSWNAFETIAKVAYPILVQLKATKQGYPLVDDEDLPSGALFEPQEVSNNSIAELRWNCVLNEIIWVMKEIAEGEPNAPVPPDYGTLRIDYDKWLGLTKVYNARIQKGCELFGKYFRNLWD